jgi:DNA-binding PucR family transcriptional regulator
MHSFLERYDAVCATSMEFMNLRTLPEAYEKACLALKYSGRFYGDELLERYEQDAREKRLFRYDDNLAFYLLGENERSHSIWKDSTYAQALRTLWEYDKQHNTDNLQLLYTYLRCERKATDASQRLHMHRNNVVYRISRIQELLGLDLDDEQVRLCLTLSYLMLRLNGLEE